eukprot:scaffold114885_cov63-Phaeocystis_antarctica.AAC.6
MLVRLLVTRRIEGGSGARPTDAFRSALGSTPHTSSRAIAKRCVSHSTGSPPPACGLGRAGAAVREGVLEVEPRRAVAAANGDARGRRETKEEVLARPVVDAHVGPPRIQRSRGGVTALGASVTFEDATSTRLGTRPTLGTRLAFGTAHAEEEAFPRAVEELPRLRLANPIRQQRAQHVSSCRAYRDDLPALPPRVAQFMQPPSGLGALSRERQGRTFQPAGMPLRHARGRACRECRGRSRAPASSIVDATRCSRSASASPTPAARAPVRSGQSTRLSRTAPRKDPLRATGASTAPEPRIRA